MAPSLAVKAGASRSVQMRRSLHDEPSVMVSSRANLAPKMCETRPATPSTRFSQTPRGIPPSGMRACSGVVTASRTEVEKRSRCRP
eukprot:scaffold6550_cov131-Isochrysis_galbana.AAC.5